MKHVIVAREEGRFLGWPANDGVWSWGDEIVVGYTNGAYEFKASGHRIRRMNREDLSSRPALPAEAACRPTCPPKLS